MRTKDEIMCMIEEYNILDLLHFRESMLNDKTNDPHRGEFDIQHIMDIKLQVKEHELYLSAYGASKNYARAANYIKHGCAEYIKEFLESFTTNEIKELINFAIEIEQHECFVVLLNFAKENGIELKPKLELL